MIPSSAQQTASPLVMHLKELRNRLMVSIVVVLIFSCAFFYFKEQVMDTLVAPLAKAQGGSAMMISTGVGELFFVYLKTSFLGGLFVALPILLWQLWCFVAPALYDSEKKFTRPFVIATPVLFYLGGVFTYLFVMPVVVAFFFGFSSENVQQLPAIKEYLSFFTRMVFAFGLAFELPVFLLILMKFGVITRDAVASFRRYAYVIIFVVAALLTPPDPASQLLLAVPLILLFELSNIMAWLLKIGENKTS